MPRQLLNDEPLTAQIPADVDQPDKILYGLTARQVAILAATGLGCALSYSLLHSLVPMPLAIAALFPLLTLGVVVTVSRRDGMSLDRLALAALLHTRTTKQRVCADGPVVGPAAFGRARRGRTRSDRRGPRRRAGPGRGPEDPRNGARGPEPRDPRAARRPPRRAHLHLVPAFRAGQRRPDAGRMGRRPRRPRRPGRGCRVRRRRPRHQGVGTHARRRLPGGPATNASTRP